MSSAKAAHAVLLCEMESGVLSWSDTIQIDRIRRAVENFCTDFIHWKNQPDFQFGLVPLTNLVVPDDSSYGGGGVLSDPIQQHFAVKVSGLPNFMGTRISLWSQLNISKWNFFRNYWVDS